MYNEKGETTDTNITLPAVFRAPIRPDIVNFVHFQMKRNSRQPYAVNKEAGTIIVFSLENMSRAL